MTHVFEILEEIGDSLPLAVGEHRLVQAITGFSCDILLTWCSKVAIEAESYLHSMRSCRCPSRRWAPKGVESSISVVGWARQKAVVARSSLLDSEARRRLAEAALSTLDTQVGVGLRSPRPRDRQTHAVIVGSFPGWP